MPGITNNTIKTIQFGSTASEIDDLAHKVLTGEKTATSSLHDYHLLGLKKQCNVGDQFFIVDSTGNELATVEIVKIELRKFEDITEQFAVEEGDGSLENWLCIHWPYYSRLLAEIGKELYADTVLVCEWFKIIEK